MVLARQSASLKRQWDRLWSPSPLSFLCMDTAAQVGRADRGSHWSAIRLVSQRVDIKSRKEVYSTAKEKESVEIRNDKWKF